MQTLKYFIISTASSDAALSGGQADLMRGMTFSHKKCKYFYHTLPTPVNLLHFYQLLQLSEAPQASSSF